MDAGRISIGHQPVVPRSPGDRAAPPADCPATRPKIAAFLIAVPPTSHGMHARRGSTPAQPAAAPAAAAGAHVRVIVPPAAPSAVAPPRANGVRPGPAVRILLTGPQNDAFKRIAGAAVGTAPERRTLVRSLMSGKVFTPQSAPALMTALVRSMGVERAMDEVIAPVIFCASRGSITPQARDAAINALLGLRRAGIGGQEGKLKVPEVSAFGRAVGKGMNLQNRGDLAARSSGMEAIRAFAARVADNRPQAIARARELVLKELPAPLRPDAGRAFDLGIRDINGYSAFA